MSKRTILQRVYALSDAAPSPAYGAASRIFRNLASDQRDPVGCADAIVGHLKKLPAEAQEAILTLAESLLEQVPHPQLDLPLGEPTV